MLENSTIILEPAFQVSYLCLSEILEAQCGGLVQLYGN